MQAASIAVAPRVRTSDDVIDTARLWTSFVLGRDAAVREQLIAAYAGFARIMAAKVYARRVYTEMEFGDYLQYATVGMIEAIDRFEPQRGHKFETYAAPRVNGAILSGVEESSEIQQQITARRRVITQRVASLDGGAAQDRLDLIGPQEIFARLAEVAIGLAVGFALEDSGMHRPDDADYADNSYHGVELKQLQSRMTGMVAELTGNQHAVVYAHYMQHIGFDDIAQKLQLSRGRVSQIHKEALGVLRARLQDRGGIDLSC